MPPANMQQKKLATSTGKNSTLVLDRSSAFPAMDPPMADRLQYSRNPASSSPAASSMAGTLNRPVSRPTPVSTSSSGSVTPGPSAGPERRRWQSRPPDLGHPYGQLQKPRQSRGQYLSQHHGRGLHGHQEQVHELGGFSRITLAAVPWPYSSTRK